MGGGTAAQVPLPEGLAKRVSPHGRVTAVSMMKDEGPYLLEWIAHHLAVGFTDIVVYTNDCTDGTDAMLTRLEAMGLAHHRVNAIPPGLRPQPSALNHAQQEPLIAASDWVMVFDADEFLCIRHGDGTLDGLIGAAKDRGANGIVVTWRIFGSGGVRDWSRDPVTEQYLMAAPPDWNKGWGVKTLFMYDPDRWKLGIHRPKIRNKWLETDFPASVKWLNGSGRPMEDYFRFRGWRSITRTVGYDWVQMNHYAVKSVDSYAMRKFRGNVNFKKDKYDAGYWALQDRNEIRDDTMLRYAAERQRIFDALLTDPELNRLHVAALDRFEERLAAFRATDAYAGLVAGLKAAGETPITAVEARPPQARDPAKIAALMSRVEKQMSERQRAERKSAEPDAAPLYAGPLADVAGGAESGWHSNHGTLLPADPAVFTATGLARIEQGKFQRSLARALPRLVAKGALHLDLGGGCGFLSALIAREAPGLRQVVVATGPGHRALIERVWARNGLAPGPMLELRAAPLPDAETLAELIAALAPSSVIASDPAAPFPLTEALRRVAARQPGRALPLLLRHGAGDTPEAM